MVSAGTVILDATSRVLAVQACKAADFEVTHNLEAELLAAEITPASDTPLCDNARSAGRAPLDSPLAWYDGCYAPSAALHCKEIACLDNVVQADQHPVRQSPIDGLVTLSSGWLASFSSDDCQQSHLPESPKKCILPQGHSGLLQQQSSSSRQMIMQKLLTSLSSKPSMQNATDGRAAAAATAEAKVVPVQPLQAQQLQQQQQGQMTFNHLHQQNHHSGCQHQQLLHHVTEEERAKGSATSRDLGLLHAHMPSSQHVASGGVPDVTLKPHAHAHAHAAAVLPGLVTTSSVPHMCVDGLDWVSPGSPVHSPCHSHSSCVRTFSQEFSTTRNTSTCNSFDGCFSSQPSLLTRSSLRSHSSALVRSCCHKQHLQEQHKPRCSLSRLSGSFHPCCSLKTALVRLEQAGSRASRLMDSLNAGLMRLTSVSMAAGVLKQPVAHEVLRDWEFGPQLGCGASCVTRLVVNRTTGQPAACKTINKAGLFASAAAKAVIMDVQREIAIMQQVVGDPHIVQLHQVYEDARAVHLVMEWCSGGSVVDLMLACPGSCLDERAAAAVMKSVLEVLSHCHSRGLMHRDIKPDNLLISQRLNDSSQLTADAVKVTDFGISILVPQGQVLTELAGTLDYMAPELLQRRYDQQADIWSAGVMLHELLTGRVPFEAESCEQMLDAILSTDVTFNGSCWGSVSAEAKQLCGLMLTKDVEQRPSAELLLKLFSTWLQQGVAPAS